MTITNGTVVSLEYTVKLDDQTVLDTNVGSAPLTYTQGSQQIIPGVEKGVEGMKIGESKRITVPPEDAYGVVDPRAIQEIPRAQIPEDALHVGAQLQGQDPSGRSLRARVVDVKDDAVVLDFNHPLAGKTLYFEVKVLNIQPPPVQ